jgi:hypothetical protein
MIRNLVQRGNLADFRCRIADFRLGRFFRHGHSILIPLRARLEIANILPMAANPLSRAQGRMGEYVRRFKGRLGKAEGIVAGPHKLARIIWAMVVSGQPYDEAKALFDQPPPASRAASKTSKIKPRPST